MDDGCQLTPVISGIAVKLFLRYFHNLCSSSDCLTKKKLHFHADSFQLPSLKQYNVHSLDLGKI